MDEYSIVKAFQEMEETLIKSMSRNLARHLAEEDKEDMNWSQWQVEQLKALQQFRNDNQELFKDYFSTINDEIDIMIQKCYNNAGMEQEAEILKAIREGYKAPNEQDSKLQGAFFNVDNKKLKELIKAINNDMETAETAMLRMTNDQYRKIIYQSQVYANTGTYTIRQAIDKATNDFLSAGINCIEYKNGNRVSIDSYVEMAIRTANKRASIMAASDKREEWGIHLVVVPPRGTGCPFCVPYQGKVMIDDVYSKGSKKDGKYTLLSTAMKNGFLHPNCKDTVSTYFEGINSKPKSPTIEENAEKVKVYNLQQKQRYNERMIRKYKRLELGSIDKENKDYYKSKVNQWTNANKQLIADNSEFLRENTSRYKTNGIELHKKVKDSMTNIVEKVKMSSQFKDTKAMNEYTYFSKEQEKFRLDSIKQLTGYNDEEAQKALEALCGNSEQYKKVVNSGGDYKAGWFYGQDNDIRNLVNDNASSKAKIIDKYIQNAPHYDGTIYRGLALDESSIKSFEIGGTFTENGVLASWTNDKNVAEMFASGRAEELGKKPIIIKCDNIKDSTPIAHLSIFGNEENEVLVSNFRNKNYEISNITEESGIKTIILKEK